MNVPQKVGPLQGGQGSCPHIPARSRGQLFKGVARAVCHLSERQRPCGGPPLKRAYERYVVTPLHCGAAIGPRLTAVSWLVGLANFVVEMAVTMHLPTCGHCVLNHVACVDVAVFPPSVERIMGPWTPCRTWREISISKQTFVKLHCVQYTITGAVGDTPNLI